MAFSRAGQPVDGYFVEKSHAGYFEFTHSAGSPFEGYGTKIWVADGGEYRWAGLKKTVVHVVVDEMPDGSPVVEIWKLKRIEHYKGK